MYTKERDDTYEVHWIIRDPDGDCLFIVVGDIESDIALSHLNR